MRFRLITYNIHKGIGGVDRRYDLQRIIDVISSHAPDIVFLQEVDEGVRRSGFESQVERLANALNFTNYIYQRNVSVGRGHYGNAILSNFILENQVDLELKVAIKKNRRALISRCVLDSSLPDASVLLCNTHLGLSGLERRVQLRRILGIDEIEEQNLPAILGGDFNDVWAEHGKKFMLPRGFKCAVNNAKTFPAAMPVRSLDAVYYRGDLNLLNSYTCTSKLARQASDHLPVIADFEFLRRLEGDSDS